MPSSSPTVQESTITPMASSTSGSTRKWVLLLLSLGLVTIFLLRGITKGEFSENVDETVHACSGLFVASFLHDLPLRHPVQYTYRYYAQYPSLGIVMYPPGFYFLEGLAFFVFGPSVVTARMTILVIALVGWFFWFKLVNELEDEYTAALSTILLAFIPSVLNYAKVVMLDIPLMSFCIAASYFWIVYLRRGLSRDLYGFAAFFTLAFYTKHHAIYLLLWCPITLILLKKWNRMLNWKFAAAGAVSCALIAPVYLLQIFMNKSLTLNVEGTSATPGLNWSYYWLKLPEQIGWGAVVLSLTGIAIYIWRGNRENTAVMLAWIFACYVIFTLVRHKDPRYIIYWVPAFAYFAVAPFTRKNSVSWLRYAGMGLVVLMLVSYSARAWAYQRFYVSGYAELAQRLTKSQGGCVLIDMDLPGNFIFFMRAYDPARRFVILRKALYDVRTVREWGVEEFAHNQDDVEQILKQDSVQYVVTEENGPLYFSSQTALREILNHSGQYKMLESLPVESNMKWMQGRSLSLYEASVPMVVPHGTLHIKMQNLTHDIDIPFDELTGK